MRDWSWQRTPGLEAREVQIHPTGNATGRDLMEPREEGVDFLHLDKSEILIFWARWLNSKGNDAIIRRVKRDKV